MSQQTHPGAATDDCDLCIVGAGYAGLNGLNAAAKHLAKGARVVFVDRGEAWGGQWVGQYDFVRLHQPYRMFTAGDQKWKLDREPSHLATRREVLDHLESVPRESAPHLEVRPYFRHAYEGHEVRDGKVEVEARPVDPTAPGVRIRAKRLLDARGFDIPILPAFPLSSNRVRSVSVADPVLLSGEFLEDDRPVYVVGSGKTAMDCALHVIRGSRSARRELHVITGQGMWFLVRDTLYPTGIARHFRGRLASELFLHLATSFDGTNEAALLTGLAREGFTHTVFPSAENFRLGTLSVGERREIEKGVAGSERGHLVDVDGLSMAIRTKTGTRTVAVKEGAWFVNCTTHLHDRGHEPLTSDGGLVCKPQFPAIFSGTSAYLLTHLWYGGGLERLSSELYRFDVSIEPKLRMYCQASLAAVANLVLMGEHLPRSVFANFEGDFNKWYPLHRQLVAFARMMLQRKRVLRNAETLLRTRYSDPPRRVERAA